jgi:hypothetical protein
MCQVAGKGDGTLFAADEKDGGNDLLTRFE